MSYIHLKFCILISCFLFSFSSGAIYNLKTKKESSPNKPLTKSWILVAQGCHSCTEVLSALKVFCEGKKPHPSKIGFFVTGQSVEAMLKKLKGFKKDYEIFSGSPNEFYQTYKIQGSPSLLTAKGKILSGKKKILKFLKKGSDFCST